MLKERVEYDQERDQVGILLGESRYIFTLKEWESLRDEVDGIVGEPEVLERDREAFLRKVNELAKYWAETPEYDAASGRSHSIRDRIDGALFSLLAHIDGCSDGLWSLRRVHTDSDGNVVGEGPDIGGGLHELMGNYRES